ncbi:hypothetical protein [uncultured Flavobacterium sp.]|uniref:hypothetical protein n=1 Tax=uncultured Flavobacterium sp. TaxID=165435 RepID=UPI0025DDEAC1|nr:hypothetical protein [uncultured Flavobacterium sp.]
MKKIYILFLLVSFQCLPQSEKQIKEIVDEGKKLYKSEMASWYGTDIFMDNYKNKEKIGGYFSYTDKEESKCIFFSREENPKVIGTIIFDETFSLHTAKTELKEREFTKTETELHILRKKTKDLIVKDTLFKHYENASLNIIPIIYEREKKVYVLTGPSKNGYVIFGNDYLLKFDKKNNVISKKQLHKNIITIDYQKNSSESAETMHNHLPETGDYITSTDICTLMLYEKFANWDKHFVVSKKYISIWDCKTDELQVMTTEAMEKIAIDKNK